MIRKSARVALILVALMGCSQDADVAPGDDPGGASAGASPAPAATGASGASGAAAVEASGVEASGVEAPAGDAVAVDPPGVWDEAPSTRWTLREELRIGTVEGGGASSFGRVRDVLPATDGRAWVFDGLAYELRPFDGEGRHVRSAGRPGLDPGGRVRGGELRIRLRDTDTHELPGRARVDRRRLHPARHRSAPGAARAGDGHVHQRLGAQHERQ